MKKIIFRTMAIVLVLGVAACSRTDETADTPSDQKITELGVIAQSTRSTLGDDNWVEWDANDSFSVFSSMSFSSEFTIKELLDEGHGAKLEGMTIPADTYYILYPYIMDAMIAEGKIHARNIVPATQPLVENTFDHKQNPAVGHTEGAETVAPMKNIAGLVKVRVTGKIDLRRITLMSNSDNELIAGTGTIDAKTSELTIDESEGSASVTLTASKSIPLTDTPKTFYFVVAPRTFASGFTLTFIGSKEGKNYRFTHTTHNEATITASKILNITKVFDIDITEETVEMEPGSPTPPTRRSSSATTPSSPLPWTATTTRRRKPAASISRREWKSPKWEPTHSSRPLCRRSTFPKRSKRSPLAHSRTARNSPRSEIWKKSPRSGRWPSQDARS